MINKEQLKYLLFLVIPGIIIFYISINTSAFYESIPYDPDYCYLLNGLNLASFHNVIGHIDHPGTPVQVISAIIIRITYFFRTSTNDLITDVITFPEYYLKVIAWTFSLINLTILFYFGTCIFRLTNNLFYGLLFQSIPFYSITILKHSFYRNNPDPVLFILIIIFVFVFILHNYFDRFQKQIKVKYDNSTRNISFEIDIFVLILSMLTGLLLAVKINSLPILILSILLINTLKNKAIFIILTLLFFVFFTLPIINQYPHLFNWLYGLFIHSGHHLQGPTNVVNLPVIFSNMYLIIKHEPIFVIIILVSIIHLLYNYKSISYDKHVKTLLLLTIVQLLSIIMVSKQFTFHYLIPVLPTIFINIFILLHSKTSIINYNRIIIISFLLLCYSLSIFQLINNPFIIPKKIESSNQNIYSFGCASRIYALYFGNVFSGGMFTKPLEKLYGEQFFYDIWSRKFSVWNTDITFDSLKIRRKKLYLFISDSEVNKLKPDFKLVRKSTDKYIIE